MWFDNIGRAAQQDGFAFWQILCFLVLVLCILAVYLRRITTPTTSRLHSGEQALEVLPDEALVQIFAFLSVEELGHASSACQRFHRLSHESRLWRAFAGRDLEPELISKKHTFESWKLFYKRHMLDAKASPSLVEMALEIQEAYRQKSNSISGVVIAPILLAICIIIFVHWYPKTYSFTERMSESQFTCTGNFIECAVGALFFHLVLLFLLWVVFPILGLLLRPADWILSFIGRSAFDKVANVIGISLGDHQTTSVILGASFIVFVEVIVVLFVLAGKVVSRIQTSIRERKRRVKWRLQRGFSLKEKAKYD